MPLVVYSLWRLALLAVVFVVVWAAGADPLLAGVVAVVVAALVSYLLLRRQRDASAAWIAQRVASRTKHQTAFSRAVAEDEAAEDEAAS
ncbi:DUF4229 domain-containing protein [Xylanimonas protaetiae]|uniref:DUF4229 domain-containing protein n=1 Tax=Xylanimonas protaetiae TaxID=2509457 RepID=UPI0013ED3BCF|nr:DUF4229 domain-containing protein [Xylanimonas protaetiae]